MPDGEPAVRLDRVTKSFGTRKVLDDVSFEVAPGCGFVILGRSGTGKSVLLRHIIGLVQPGSGPRVRRRGDEVSALAGPELSQGAAVDRLPVPERGAVRLDLGRRERRVPDAASHPARATRRSASARSRSSPRSGSSANTTRCRRRCRAACASAPAWPARWRSTRRCCWSTSRAPGSIRSPSDEIDTLLFELKDQGGTTIVIVTHNIPSARRLGDELVMLHEGTILAQGTAEELDRSDNEMVRAFMQSQHSG